MASSLSPLKVDFEVHMSKTARSFSNPFANISLNLLFLFTASFSFKVVMNKLVTTPITLNSSDKRVTSLICLELKNPVFMELLMLEVGILSYLLLGCLMSMLFGWEKSNNFPILRNTICNNFAKPAEFQGIDKFDKDLTTLHPILTECRVIKSDLEIDLIQYANDISSEAHIEVMRKAKVDMKEYQLESIFLHHTYMYGGCRHCSYTCICATGDNSAVLHYGHAAAPNDKTLEDGDMALLDMGAEYHFYGSDITCSYPINGKFTSDQSLIYNAVLDAHNAVISSMKPGVSWVDMHILSHKVILESLKKGHIVVGNVDDTMVACLGSVFMPHGLGHLLGIDTHDPGGYPKGLERRKEPGLKALRTARGLQEGMVITVEPGCYFIEALLLPAMNNPETSKFFNKEVITRFIGFGGVRIESDVLVTATGCYNMTKCPREIHEIEAVMAGAPWPVKKTSTGVGNGLESKA
ncbi:Xaa-Pro dipeptidase [Trifolium repens]|nr:Xaa-Pro dipeptidase [Trifolium repens]